MRLALLIGLALLLSSTVFAIEKKELPATRISGSVTIDGVMDELEWSQAEVATDFVQREPNTGAKATLNTEVKILYDDEAIYIGALLHDHSPDSILRQLTQRDEIGNSDFFGVNFDCYQDGINGLEFMVTAAGVQADTKYGQNNQDDAWNAVWWSKVVITDEGWIVEMKIPYAALRFPETPEQEWHLNIFRNIRRIRETSFWSEIDPKIEGFFNQCGLLTDIRNISPPTRLFFYPYLSAYVEKDDSESADWQSTIVGGMDLKYGISDAFTLDMTLVPDFGQVQSDNQVLNLSPFEVRFNENRQFFTEGTELFNKADIFYSRRIGGTPLRHYDIEDELADDEEIIENPSVSNLINATKVSGRNSKGLGIGIFNAITGTTNARVRNTESNAERIEVTDPLSNYSVLVLDQNLRSNSYVSLVNTNVWREGSDYEANVTATEFSLRNKDNSRGFNGSAALSQKYYSDSTDLGYAYYVGYNKSGGNINYGLEHYIENDTYDPNDLGLLFANNEIGFEGYFGHRQTEPSDFCNRSNNFFNIGYSRRYLPNRFQNFYLNYNFFVQTKKFHAFGGFLTAEPVTTYDFFEPRSGDRFYLFPKNYNGGTWISSDYRKRFALDIEWNYRWFDDEKRQRFNFNISPRFRVNDKLMLITEYGKFNFNNDVGWVNELDEGEIVFGRRNQDIHETSLNAQYVFNNVMGLSLIVRHYWTNVTYIGYRELAEDGNLRAIAYDGLDEVGLSEHNANFNAFNVDMVYRWVFSPGSEMSIVWKNSILGEETTPRYDYADNLQETLSLDQVNSFSIRILYFLDYRSLKGKQKKEPECSLGFLSGTSIPDAHRLKMRRVM